MVINLDPLNIDLDFERKSYRLGETISGAVTLIPSRDVEIRDVSILLMGNVRRTKIEDRVGVGRMPDMGAQSSYVPTAQHMEHEVSTEVFYRASIMSSMSLRKGEASRHDLVLRLDPKPLRLQRLSKEAKRLQKDSNRGLIIDPWWLEARVDVVMGRDAVARRQVEIIGALKATT